MKKIVCEMCGSNDLLKKDGVFECQSCGTKYTVEEAKKMMVDGVVNIEGTVKLDTNDELKKLYQAARNARKTGDDVTALKHYEKINAMDPDSWEALFYLVILKTNKIKNGEILSASISIYNSLNRIFQLISALPDENERKNATKEIVLQCVQTTNWLTSASENFYSSLSHTTNSNSENFNRCFNIANIMCYCGNLVEKYFGLDDSDYRLCAIICWKNMLDFDKNYKFKHFVHIFNKQSLELYSEKLETNENLQYIEEHKEELESLQKEVADERKKLNDNLKKLDELLEEKSNIEEEIDNSIPFINEVDVLNDEIEKLKKEKSSLGLLKGKEKKEIQKKIDSYDEKIEKLIEKIEKEREKIKKQYESELNKIDNKIDKLDKTIEKNKKIIEDKLQKLNFRKA